MNGLLLAILASGQEPLICESRCEWIERNVVYEICRDEIGNPKVRVILDQLIFWRTPNREEVIAWRFADKVRFISEGSGVSCVWHEGDRLIRVRAKYLIHSATEWDVEVWNREVVPIDKRRGIGTEGERLYWSIRVMRMKEQP